MGGVGREAGKGGGQWVRKENYIMNVALNGKEV